MANCSYTTRTVSKYWKDYSDEILKNCKTKATNTTKCNRVGVEVNQQYDSKSFILSGALKDLKKHIQNETNCRTYVIKFRDCKQGATNGGLIYGKLYIEKNLLKCDQMRNAVDFDTDCYTCTCSPFKPFYCEMSLKEPNTSQVTRSKTVHISTTTTSTSSRTPTTTKFPSSRTPTTTTSSSSRTPTTTTSSSSRTPTTTTSSSSSTPTTTIFRHIPDPSGRPRYPQKSEAPQTTSTLFTEKTGLFITPSQPSSIDHTTDRQRPTTVDKVTPLNGVIAGNSGAIIGLVIGGVVVVILILMVLFLYKRKHHKKSKTEVIALSKTSGKPQQLNASSNSSANLIDEGTPSQQRSISNQNGNGNYTDTNDIKDDGIYNALNGEDQPVNKSPGDNYHHVRAFIHNGADSDYDELQLNKPRREVILIGDDDYDHCKPRKPNDEKEEDDYDHLPRK